MIEADDDRAEHRDRLGLQQSADGLVRRHQGAGQDRGDDRDACEVLDMPQAIREAAGRPSPSQPERDAERDRRGRVGEVVDGVRKERDAPRERDDDHLEERGREQADERPLERPQAPARGGDRRIDEPVRVAVPVAACPWTPGRARRWGHRHAGDGEAYSRGPCLPPSRVESEHSIRSGLDREDSKQGCEGATKARTPPWVVEAPRGSCRRMGQRARARPGVGRVRTRGACA